MFAAGACLAGASSTEAAASAVLHVSLTVSLKKVRLQLPLTALMVQEDAENSVEEDSPPCEGGSDTVVSRYVPSRMVWINIH